MGPSAMGQLCPHQDHAQPQVQLQAQGSPLARACPTTPEGVLGFKGLEVGWQESPGPCEAHARRGQVERGP